MLTKTWQRRLQNVAKTKGLGKGFDELIPVGVNIATITASPNERIHRLAIDIVVPKSDQPRQYFDEEKLRELAQSIETHGVLQPIVVNQIEPNVYSIIAGERRWRASQIAGLTDIPAIIRTSSEHESLELALLENVQRADLTAIELALTIQRLHTQFNQAYDEIAKRLGKAKTTINNIVRLLGLPPIMQKALAEGKISEGHARSLLSLQQFPDSQKELFNKILKLHISVREAEQFVVKIKQSKSKDDKTKKPESIQPINEVQINKLQKRLGTKIILRHSARGSGKLVINYDSEATLAKVVQQILHK